MIGLTEYLTVAAILFTIGVFGSRRSGCRLGHSGGLFP